MLGGEVWSTEMAKEIAVCFKKAEILNMYGPTEATIWISSYTIPRDKLDTMNKIPIGRPVNNNQILILDQDMNLCAAGIPGKSICAELILLTVTTRLRIRAGKPF